VHRHFHHDSLFCFFLPGFSFGQSYPLHQFYHYFAFCGACCQQFHGYAGELAVQIKPLAAGGKHIIYRSGQPGSMGHAAGPGHGVFESRLFFHPIARKRTGLAHKIIPVHLVDAKAAISSIFFGWLKQPGHKK
jgi:hypothetical protein